MRKFWTLWLVLSFLLFLVACGGIGANSNLSSNGNPGANGGGGTPPPSSTPSPSPSPSPSPTPTPPPPTTAPTTSLTVSPASVAFHQTGATLSWNTSNATTVTIDNGIGQVAASGSMPVNPDTTTTYTLTATGPGGTASPATAKLTVVPAVSFSATPATIRKGAQTTLTWQVSDANSSNTSVTIDNGIGTVSVGSSKLIKPLSDTTYTLTATVPDGSTATATASVTVTAPPNNINDIDHVVVMMQENRSFDHYFANMTNYRHANNIPINSSDGKLRDLTDAPGWTNFSPGLNQSVPPHHATSQCTETITPDWQQSLEAMSAVDHGVSAGPNAPMDGFIDVAWGISQFQGNLVDKNGLRAFGYYTENELNYYYFMASQFAMGDAFHSPVPTRTLPNRLYIHAATSQGHIHEPTATNPWQLTSPTIWQLLDKNGISWKIYLTDLDPSCSANGWDFCAPRTTYLQFFVWNNGNTAAHAHFAPADCTSPAAKLACPAGVTDYFTDVKNGNLPAVAFIEAGYFTGRDEHPTDDFTSPPNQIPIATATRVQAGANYVSTLINALMTSQSWYDSVFFFTFDEGGGLLDHKPPAAVPNPDGITPVDYLPGDVQDDFTFTGFRIPNFIVSPYAKKNYVSHTSMDYTAYLKFIETRWNLPSLTKRDAFMPDMKEFFDFTDLGPWATPPNPPAQNQGAPCDWNLQ